MMRKRLWAVAAVALCACGVGSNSEQPTFVQRDSAGVHIVESTRPSWGEGDRWHIGTDPLFIIHAWEGGAVDRPLDPTSIDIDSRGRIIVGDGDLAGWQALLVYDSTGHFLFKAGGKGQGPGEFGQLWWARAYRGDSLVAFDMSGKRASVFDPDGNFARSVRLPSLEEPQPQRGMYAFSPSMEAAYGDGHFLASPVPFARLQIDGGPGPAWYHRLLFRLDATAQTWDTLGLFPHYQVYWSGTERESYPYGAVSVRAVTDRDLYVARGDAFEIRRYNSAGDLDRIVRRAFAKQVVSEEDRAEYREWSLSRMRSSPYASSHNLKRARRRLETAHFAQTAPALSAILIDEGDYLWAEEFRWFGRTERPPTVRPAYWSVFDSSGVWLGNVEMPLGFILHAVGPDRVLGFMIDVDGINEIYAFPLDRRPGTEDR
jgi:hypothetical protein